MRGTLSALALSGHRHHQSLPVDLEIADPDTDYLAEPRPGRRQRHDYPTKITVPSAFLVDLSGGVEQLADVVVR